MTFWWSIVCCRWWSSLWCFIIIDDNTTLDGQLGADNNITLKSSPGRHGTALHVSELLQMVTQPCMIHCLIIQGWIYYWLFQKGARVGWCTSIFYTFKKTILLESAQKKPLSPPFIMCLCSYFLARDKNIDCPVSFSSFKCTCTSSTDVSENSTVSRINCLIGRHVMVSVESVQDCTAEHTTRLFPSQSPRKPEILQFCGHFQILHSWTFQSLLTTTSETCCTFGYVSLFKLEFSFSHLQRPWYNFIQSSFLVIVLFLSWSHSQ